MNEDKALISLNDFEEFLSLKIRVDIAVRKIIRYGYISTEELLWILGTELAIKKAEEIREEERQCCSDRGDGFKIFLEDCGDDMK